MGWMDDRDPLIVETLAFVKSGCGAADRAVTTGGDCAGGRNQTNPTGIPGQFRAPDISAN
jgi:hypothetical protein